MIIAPWAFFCHTNPGHSTMWYFGNKKIKHLKNVRCQFKNVCCTYYRNIYLNSLNFRAEPLREQMVARNYYFFARYTTRKLNVREIFLLKRGAKNRLRET